MYTIQSSLTNQIIPAENWYKITIDSAMVMLDVIMAYENTFLENTIFFWRNFYVGRIYTFIPC